MITRLCFNYTNNVVEYEGYAMGVRAAIESKAKVLEVYGDLTLVIPREDNQLANALATLLLMFELNQEESLSLIKIKSHEQHAYCHFIQEELDG